MLCNAIDKDQINIFFGSRYLYFHMRKISVMLFSFVDQRRFYFTLPLISELCCQNLFSVQMEFTLCSKTNDIVLLQFIQFQEHLVVIVASVHDESCFVKQRCATFHC